MNTLAFTAVLLAIAASPGGGGGPVGGGGGAPYEALDAGDVFVATITRVEDKGATNAKPPRVWLEVQEVIRGDAKVARSPAVWSPPFHGVDWGGGEKLVEQWKVKPLKGPKVGGKFILGGKLWPALPNQRPNDYEIFSFVRIPYSDAARKQTIAHLAALDAERARYAAEVAAAKQALDLRRQKWRAAMTDEVIDKRTQEADIVAIGTITGGSGYEIETLLKGQPPGAAGAKFYLTIPTESYDKRVVEFAYERPRSILFLSTKNLTAGVTSITAQFVDPLEGFVPADDAALAAVKKSLQNKPAPPPKPVLVISALHRPDAAPLAQAARANFTVVTSHQFSGHGDNSIVHVKGTIPYAAFFVMIDPGPPRRVRAVQFTPDGATPLYDATWEKPDSAEQLQALVKKLADAAK